MPTRIASYRDFWALRRSSRAQKGTSRQRGFSLVEVLTAVAITAIVCAIAIPRGETRRVNIVTAQRMVMANLRLARTDAITKGVHFKLTLSATQVTLTRMVESPVGSGTWIADTSYATQTTTLPSATQFSSPMVNKSVEFNTRGYPAVITIPTPAAPAAAVPQINMTDTFGNTKSIQIWSSGQVNEL